MSQYGDVILALAVDRLKPAASRAALAAADKAGFSSASAIEHLFDSEERLCYPSHFAYNFRTIPDWVSQKTP